MGLTEAIALILEDGVKRALLLRHLRRHGCHLKREGRSHSLWISARTGAIEAIPRHREIPDILARKN